MIGSGLLFYLLYVFCSSLGLALGTIVIFKVVDKCTPFLSFAEVSKKSPHLMIILISVIILCLTWLMKAVSVNIIPVP